MLSDYLKIKILDQILIESQGISTDLFSLPPFILRKGEIIGIYTGNNDSHPTEQYLTTIFTGKEEYINTIVYKNFAFVDYIWESNWRRLLFPITVGEYLKKHSNINNPYSQKIYEIEWINKKTKINRLPGNPRKLLSLYSVLSKKENIIIDFAGQDKQGMIMVAEIIKKEGSAILFDAFNTLENYCDQYIKIEWKDGRENFNPVFPFS